MSFSAPSAINLEHSIVKFDTDLSYEQQFNNEQRTTATNNVDDQIDVVEENNTQTIINNNNSCTTNTTTTIQHDWQSMSCLTDSTEQSAPINFDLSNRARLPRGIDKIRPHIEQTDNVPLLVSLFTDCTPATIREMLNIMQDYGEIVCIMGSSANFENAGIFMRADASISVEPLYPQVCQKYEVFNLPKNACISPTELSCELNSIGCSLCVRKRDDDSISFYHLVMESRHYVAILWNAVQFWLSCCVVLSLVQVLAILLMLPAVFTPSQILWLCCVVVPCLSVSLMGVPVDANVMKKPQGKNQIALNFNVTLFILWCYGLKFVPTIIVIFLFYIGILTSHCVDLCAIISTTNNNNNCTCVLFYLPTITTVIVDNNITNSNLIVTDNINNNYIWDENSWTISLTRLLLILLVLLHFVIISAGFVYRDCLVIRKLPYRNLFWLLTVFILIILQSLYTMYEYGVMIDTYHIDDQFAIPIWCVIIAVLSPIIVCFVNELIKHQEIMVNTRFQKRARLDFGTKLGMNSPF